MTHALTDASLCIRPAESPDQQCLAVELLCSEDPPESRQEQARRLLAGEPSGGLFLAWRRDQPVGSVLARGLAGRAGAVWAPRTIADAPPTTAIDLLNQAVGHLRSSGVAVAQAQLPSNEGEDAKRFQVAGFQPFCRLLYLTSVSEDFPNEPPTTRLELECYSPANHRRLAHIVASTYDETLDCPGMNGLREIKDVLEGYQATGEFDASRWLIARHEGRDVGCLLLAAHAEDGMWELVYQGIVPAARGQRFGMDLTRYAQWRTRQAGVAQLVLAVDAANEPALRIYAAAGFTSWEQRWIFVNMLAETKS